MVTERVGEAACPFIGLLDDPATRFAFPDGSHRCHALERAVTVDLTFQGSYCLTGDYVRCPRYLSARSPEMAGAAGSAPVSGSRSRPAIAQARRVTFEPNRTSMRVAVALLGVTLLTVAVVVVFAGQGGTTLPTTTPPGQVSFPAVVPSTPIAAATPTLTPSPSAGTTPSPTATPSPTPGPTPSAAPTPTVAPTPSPSPSPLIHIVAPGETLQQIANQYGVSVRRLMLANGLTDRDYIQAGQELIIPQS